MLETNCFLIFCALILLRPKVVTDVKNSLYKGLGIPTKIKMKNIRPK